MPFSHAFKASLVAMVLIILTAVPRLDAAPMYPFPTWVPGYEVAKEASNLGRKPLGLDLNLPPPEEDGGFNPSIGSHALGRSVAPSAHATEHLSYARGYAGPVHPTSYAQSTGAQPWSMRNNQAGGQHVGYASPGLVPSSSTPYTHSGVPSRQRGGRPRAYGAHSAGLSYRTAARSEARQSHTSGGSSVSTSPVQPLSEDQIRSTLDGEDWQTYSLEKKSEILVSYGDSVFSPDSFDLRSPLDNYPSVFRGDSPLQRKVVEKFMNVRLEHEMSMKPNPEIPNMSQLRLSFDWRDGEEPTSPGFFTRVANSLKYPQTRTYKPATSAIDNDLKDDAFRFFILGTYNVKLVLEGDTKAGTTALKKLEEKSTEVVNVVALSRVDPKTKVYLGKAAISLVPKADARPM